MHGGSKSNHTLCSCTRIMMCILLKLSSYPFRSRHTPSSSSRRWAYLPRPSIICHSCRKVRFSSTWSSNWGRSFKSASSRCIYSTKCLQINTVSNRQPNIYRKDSNLEYMDIIVAQFHSRHRAFTSTNSNRQQPLIVRPALNKPLATEATSYSSNNSKTFSNSYRQHLQMQT